jgi:hypothetical protein
MSTDRTDDDEVLGSAHSEFEDTDFASSYQASIENRLQEVDELVNDDQELDDSDTQRATSAINGDADVEALASDTDQGAALDGDVSHDVSTSSTSTTAEELAPPTVDLAESMLRPLEEFYRQTIGASSGRFASKVYDASGAGQRQLTLTLASIATSM